MQKFFVYTTAVIIIVGLMSFTGPNMLGPGKCIAAELGPVLSMGTPLVKMSSKAKVVIMGTGFKPGQEKQKGLYLPDSLAGVTL